MFESVSAFSPGEVIFFGEHSVVYGKTAVAAAITRGIEVEGALQERGVEIRSPLGSFKAELGNFSLMKVQAGELLLPFEPLISGLLTKFRRSVGFKVSIRSSIPEQSGLASSAAVSSALIALILNLLDQRLTREEQVNLVYESELRIQKRGSILGSACTVNGGFVSVSNGKWRTQAIDSSGLSLAVIDSGERCATAVTTASVKKQLDENPRGIESLFNEMDLLAQEGLASLESKDWKKTGTLMNQNQKFLQELGVSTEKIDRLIQDISDTVYGAKITGAGGGGCIFALPKEGAEPKIRGIAERLGCRLLEAQIRTEGVSCVPRQSVCKP